MMMMMMMMTDTNSFDKLKATKQTLSSSISFWFAFISFFHLVGFHFLTLSLYINSGLYINEKRAMINLKSCPSFEEEEEEMEMEMEA